MLLLELLLLLPFGRRREVDRCDPADVGRLVSWGGARPADVGAVGVWTGDAVALVEGSDMAVWNEGGEKRQ